MTTYKSIALDDPSLPIELAEFLAQYDYDSEHQCTINYPADFQLTRYEARTYLGQGSLANGIRRFEARFPGYHLDFLQGRVVRDVPSAEEKKPGFTPAERGILKSSLEDYLYLWDLMINDKDESASSQMNERFAQYFDVLHRQDPSLVDLATLNEMTDFFLVHPETFKKYMLGDGVADFQHLFDTDEYRMAEERQITLIQQAGLDADLGFTSIWATGYLWHKGLKEKLDD